jgi:hypothetical protein
MDGVGSEDLKIKAGIGYDRRLLAHKVNWEGGVLGALQYGLRSEHIADPALAMQWSAIEDLYQKLMPRITELERVLGKAA